jgi:aspartate/methionine/tyrosine aminotransferase
VGYPLIYDHGWQMDFPSLERTVTERTRGVLVVHPNNPTGSYVSVGERELLNGFCRERGLAVIVDEVFLDYGLGWRSTSGAQALVESQLDRSPGCAALPKSSDNEQQKSFVGNQDVLTLTLSGLSKVSALPQMKVAWVVTSGPEELVESAMGRLDVIADTYLSMNAPVQWALPVLLEQRKSIQRQLMERVQHNLAGLDRQLAGQKVCERLSVEGGWYVVLRVPVTQSDEGLAIELVREKSVLVHPGHFFDFPRDGYLVLSLISAPADFEGGVRAILARVNS